MSVLQEVLSVFRTRFVQTIAIIGLFVWRAALEVNHRWALTDFDVWWHARVGSWILHNRVFPRTALFSRFGDNRSWAAYSWGFEVVASKMIDWFGIAGLCLLLIVANFAIVYALITVLQKLSGSFWTGWLLTIACFLAVGANCGIRPGLWTIFSYTIELGLLITARRSRSVSPLFGLPALFLVWANIHIQFTYGLAVLGLFVLDTILAHIASVQKWGWGADDGALPLKPVLAICVASLISTLISPYTWHLYEIALVYARNQHLYDQITELFALNFRIYPHYLQLLIFGAGCLAAGWRRYRSLFPYALLALTGVVAFRAARDGWYVCMSSLAIIADARYRACVEESERDDPRSVWLQRAVITCFALVILAVSMQQFKHLPLEAEIAEQFPLKAARFVEQSHLSGPLYNNLNWGGFLIWALPDLPVAIDGRTDLYGQDYSDRYFGLLYGWTNPSEDPDIRGAKTALLDKRFPLTTELRNDPSWVPVYEDKLAIVLVRR